MLFRFSSLLLLALLLTGCFGSPTSIPDDKFYTLNISTADIVAKKYRRIVIKRVHAYGLYNERAMLYSKAELPLIIKRYHYHHWVMPPTQIIQHGLKDYLSQSRIADEVVEQSISSRKSLQLSAELLAFQRIIGQTGSSIRIAIEFTAIYPSGQYKTFQYSENLKAKDETLHAAAIAYGNALSMIFSKLLSDI